MQMQMTTMTYSGCYQQFFLGYSYCLVQQFYIEIDLSI